MTKKRIKEEALDLFVINGYEGTSMSKIANKVNINASAIYAHYESKEQLFLIIFKDIVNEKLFEIEETKNKAGCKEINELLYTLLNNYLKLIETDKNKLVFFKRTALFAPENLKEKVREILMDYEENYSKLLIPIFTNGIHKKIIREENIDKLLAAFYCLMDGLYVLSHYYDMNDYKKVVSDVWDLFWKSIKR